MAPSGEIVLAATARAYIWKHVVQYQHTYSPYTRTLILGMNNQAETLRANTYGGAKQSGNIVKVQRPINTRMPQHPQPSLGCISWC